MAAFANKVYSLLTNIFIKESVFLELKLIHLLYIICILCIYCNLFTTRNMSERFNKGVIIHNSKWKKLLWMRKADDFISYVSIIFLIISYFTLICTVACFVVCLFVSDLVAKWLTFVLFGIICVVFIIEHFFLPAYGVRGSQ